jgi:hypothetical protein
MAPQFFVKFSNVKFNQNRFCPFSSIFICTDRPTEEASFVGAPKSCAYKEHFSEGLSIQK